MQIKELQDIINEEKLYSEFNNKLIFVEEDAFIEKLIVNMIAKKYDAEIHYDYDFANVVDKLTSNDLFSTAGIYIVRDVAYFLKQPNEFLKLKVTKNNILILIYTDTIDTKSNFYELLGKDICYFRKMNFEQLYSLIQKQVTLSKDNSKILCEICDYNTNKILNEIVKLDILHKSLSYPIDMAFEKCIKEGSIHRENNKEYQEWVDNIVNKNFEEAIKCANNISNIDDDVMRLINMLYERYKSLLISPPTKKVFSDEELNKKLELLHFVEMSIKNGYMEEEYARNYLMINLILN